MYTMQNTCLHDLNDCYVKYLRYESKLGQVIRKGVLCHMRTTKVQISLRIHTV